MPSTLSLSIAFHVHIVFIQACHYRYRNTYFAMVRCDKSIAIRKIMIIRKPLRNKHWVRPWICSARDFVNPTVVHCHWPLSEACMGYSRQKLLRPQTAHTKSARGKAVTDRKCSGGWMFPCPPRLIEIFAASHYKSEKRMAELCHRYPFQRQIRHAILPFCSIYLPWISLCQNAPLALYASICPGLGSPRPDFSPFPLNPASAPIPGSRS